LVSVNAVSYAPSAPRGTVPESIQQFIIEQAYPEALADLVQISANMQVRDVLASERAIAQAAAAQGAYAVAIRALYDVFSRAEKQTVLLTRQDWELYYPQAFADLVRSAQQKYTRVPEALIYAVMREESLFDPEIVSSAGAYGLMQLMPSTARLLSVRQNIFWEQDKLSQPETNIGYGVLYLNNLLIRYKDSLPISLAGYNAGPTATDVWYKHFSEDMDEWIENLDYRETRGYIKKVWRSFYWYKLLYFS
jgi:soluble lytic murein transglycosylase-like protein